MRPEDFVGEDAVKNEEKVREGFFLKARKSLKHLPMARETVALYYCMIDSKTPLWVKGMVAAALAYFIMPIDAIPDILPLIGFGDDAGVLAATIAAVTAHIKPEHLDKATAWIHGEVPDLEGKARVISDK